MQDFDEILSKYAESVPDTKQDTVQKDGTIFVPREVYIVHYDQELDIATLSDGTLVTRKVLVDSDPYRFKHLLHQGASNTIRADYIQAGVIQAEHIHAGYKHTNSIAVSGVSMADAYGWGFLTTGDRLCHDDRVAQYSDEYRPSVPVSQNPEAKAYPHDTYDPNDRMYLDPNLQAPMGPRIVHGADPGPPLREKIANKLEPVMDTMVAYSRAIGQFGITTWEEHGPMIRTFGKEHKNALLILFTILCLLLAVATLI